jgi:hypothetical protein
MTTTKAQVLSAAIGGEVERLMPQSRAPGVRLSLVDGRVALVDEDGGATFESEEAITHYAEDGDEKHITFCGEWNEWGICEEWATSLARLIGGQAFQSGGNIWVVLFERRDGRMVVIGDEGVDLYESAEHYDRYYEVDWPEPEFVSWTSEPQSI